MSRWSLLFSDKVAHYNEIIHEGHFGFKFKYIANNCISNELINPGFNAINFNINPKCEGLNMPFCDCMIVRAYRNKSYKRYEKKLFRLMTQIY